MIATLRLPVLLALAAMFLAAVNQLLAVTAMPAIVADLGDIDRYAWPNACYLLGGAVAMPLAARLANTYGYGLVITLGLTVFLAGCLAVSFAPTMPHLILLRGLEGAGGGALIAGSHISAVDEMPPRERGMFQGLIALVYGVAFVVGLPLGGVITDSFGWRWIFRIHLPLGLLILVLLLWARAPKRVALSKNENSGMYPGVFRDPTTMLTLTASLLVGFAMYGSTFFLPLFFQSVIGVSAASSGRLLVPMLLATIVGAVISGALMSRTSLRDRTVAVANGLCMLTGTAGLAFMSSEVYVLAAVAYSVLAGLGMGGVLATLTVVVQNTLEATMARNATAALQFGRLVGGLIGLWMMGAALSMRFRYRANAFLAEWTSPVTESAIQEYAQNPGALLGIGDAQEATRNLRQHVASDRDAEALFESLRVTLNEAIIDVFVPCLIAIVFCVIVILFLRDPKSDWDISASKPGGTKRPALPER